MERLNVFIVFCLKEKLIVNGCCQQVYFVVLFITSIFCRFEDCMDITFLYLSVFYLDCIFETFICKLSHAIYIKVSKC